MGFQIFCSNAPMVYKNQKNVAYTLLLSNALICNCLALVVTYYASTN